MTNGWLVIDKPPNITSFRVTATVRRLLGVKKVGHCGTLDPFATGVLPIALGEATKTVRWLGDQIKEYDFTVRWGAATDSGDKSGEITERMEGAKPPTKAAIAAAVPNFIGEIMQVPPIYSAIKVDGKRAYQLAREGKQCSIPPRPVFVEKLELTAHSPPTSRFLCRCGSGTYIRSLATDLAKSLKNLCYVESLVRTQVGDLKLADAITLDFLNSMGHSRAIAAVRPITVALEKLQSVEVTPSEAALLARGMSITTRPPSGELFRTECGGRLVAIAKKDEKNGIRPIRVFNLD